MQLNSTVLTIGSRPVSLLDLLISAAALGLLLLIIMAITTWRTSRARREEAIESARRTSDMEYRLAELSGALQNFANLQQGQQEILQRTLDDRLDQVSHRIGHGFTEQTERTTDQLSAIGERLAVIDAAQANLTKLSGEMLSLKDILNNKQTRGAFGQGRMEAIVRDGLHAKAFEFQATLSNGTRPDCVISLPDSALRLVIDAKFPLESYNALKKAESSDVREAAGQRLRHDILRHVKDISEKYLIQGETHETAIMFVPSESISAELHEHFEDVIQRAHRARVILASPNVLLLLVQTMQAIVKDATMREQAHVVKGEVVKLLEDVNRLKERTGDLRRHFDMANADIDKITQSSDKISKRGARIENLDLEETLPQVDTTPKPRLVAGRD
jgi:DNA recombination protein RmuC